MIQNKLVESWLDNQGERRYQPALIQLLISEGWTVLHNTRHSPLEYGKDVIARAPDGKLCALQLKGNPGSRLTKREAQSLLPQFIEAMESEIPTSYGRKKGERHKTIMVTNGEIDEEARELFDRTAVRVKNPSSPSDSVEYWARGELLARFSSHVQNVWPTSVEGLTEAIRMFGENGAEMPNPQQIATALYAAFGMAHSKMKAPEKSSHITSIFLLTEILKNQWYSRENHCALFHISVVAAVYALQFADNKKRKKLVQDYADLALNHASDLIRECLDKNYDPNFNYADSSPLSEIDIFGERARLIAEAASALVLADKTEGLDQQYLEKLITGSLQPGSLWGQFVIPSLIVRHWAWRKVDATIAPELSMISLMTGYLMAAENHRIPDQISNAAPYYRFEHVLFHSTGQQLGEESDITQDSTGGHMSFGQAIFQMLALRNLKQTCKHLWRRYSKKMHGSTVVDIPDFFSPLMSETGYTDSKQLYSETWHNLVNSAIDQSKSDKFKFFENLEWLAASYLCIVPYRAEHSFLMALDASVSTLWYHDGHRPGDPVC